MGCIVEMDDASTNTEYTIEDTTGRLKVPYTQRHTTECHKEAIVSRRFGMPRFVRRKEEVRGERSRWRRNIDLS